MDKRTGIRGAKKEHTGDGEMKNGRHENIHGRQEELSGEKKEKKRKNCASEKETKKE